MAELVLWPQGPNGRWWVTGLWNWVDASAPVVSLRLGEQLRGSGYVDRFHNAGVGAHYVLYRNLRVLGESTWDFELDQMRFVTGVSMAF